LCNNPKIEVKIEDKINKFIFKPIYNIRNRRDLLNFLKEQLDKGGGGVLLEDIQESLPKADDIISVGQFFSYQVRSLK
jgi:transcription initiation factor TFIIE subunit beta